jgi:tetratricopeptide (TPR) repeat protein
MPSHGLLRQTLALSVCVSLLAPPRARAELPPPRIWVAPTTHDGSTQTRQLSKRVQASLKEYLSKSKRFSLEDGKIPARSSTEREDPRVGQAEIYKYTATEAYKAKQYEEAEKTYKLSIKLYQASIASVKKIAGLYQALAYLAATYAALEYDGDAKDIYRQLAAIAPADFTLPEDLPAQVKKAYEKERKRLLKKKPGALNIETVPPGAQVSINGVERCVSPCEIKDLPRGSHYVQVKKKGAGKAGSVSKVKAGYVTPVKYTLTKTPVIKRTEPVTPEQLKAMNELIATGKLGAQLRQTLEEVGTEQEVAGVLVSHLVKQERDLGLFLYVYAVDEKRLFWLNPLDLRPSLSAAKISAMKSVSDLESIFPTFPLERAVDEEHEPFTAALALSAKLASGLVVPPSGPKPIAVTPPPVTPPPRANKGLPPPSDPRLLPPPPVKDDKRDDKGAWYSSTWLWVSVGTLALGAAGTASYFMLESQSQNQKFSGEVVW